FRRGVYDWLPTLPNYRLVAHSRVCYNAGSPRGNIGVGVVQVSVPLCSVSSFSVPLTPPAGRGRKGARMGDISVSKPTVTETSLAIRRAARYTQYFFWVMFMANFANYLQRFIFSGLSVPITTDLKLNDAQFGLLGTIFFIVYTAFALP